MRDPVRLGRLPVAGLVASGLLAVGAFGAGALPGGRYAGTGTGSPGDHWTGQPISYWLGLAAWLAGLVLLSATWWRLGRRLDQPAGEVSSRRLLATALLWALPLLVAPPVGSRDVYSYACQGALWLDGADPYRTGVESGGCPWSAAVAPDWRGTPAPYGPLAVALAGGAVAAARAAGGSEQFQLLLVVGLLRAVALVGALLIAGFLPRLARACGVDPAAAAWLVLLAPSTAVHLVGGVHNDALMVGLVVAAFAVAGTGCGPRPTLEVGLLLGAAAAVKVTAVLAVPFVVLLAATVTAPAGRNGWRRLAGVAVGVVGSASAIFAGLTVATGLDLGWVTALSGTGRLVQWTSPPTGLGMAAGYLLWLAGAPEAFPTAVTVGRTLGAALLGVGTVALVAVVVRRVLRGTATPRYVVTAGGLAFAAVTLLGPVFYPWYALAPLAVLAAGVTDPRWRRRIAAVVLALGFLTLPDGLGVAVLTKVPGALLVLVLVVTSAVVAARRLTRRSPT